MKKLFTILGLSVGLLSFAQLNSLKVSYADNEFEDVVMDVVVDSAEDLNDTFRVDDLKDLLELTGGQSATFTLTCRGEMMSDGERAELKYKVEKGEMSEREFLKMVKKIRKAAIAYYQNKN